MKNARVLAAVVTVALSLTLAGCVGVEEKVTEPPAGETTPPTRPIEVTPAPDTTATPLTIPEPAEGELARATFAAAGPDGVPTATSETFDVPVPGEIYTIRAECTATGQGAVLGFEVLQTDSEQSNIAGADVGCNEQPFLMTGDRVRMAAADHPHGGRRGGRGLRRHRPRHHRLSRSINPRPRGRAVAYCWVRRREAAMCDPGPAAQGNPGARPAQSSTPAAISVRWCDPSRRISPIAR